MENNKVNITIDQFEQLLETCQGNKKEVSGTLQTKTHNSVVSIIGITLDDSDIIEQSAHNRIKFDFEKLLLKMSFDLLDSTENYYIRFHTHPSFLSDCLPSGKDEGHIAEIQSFLDKWVEGMRAGVKSFKARSNITYVEAIVSKKDVVFYYYDREKQKIGIMGAMIDEKPYPLPGYLRFYNKTLKDAIMEGWNKGIKRN